ncbi:protein phosphatase 2C 51-like [Rhodamnia argentea]|uniref:protein-serine/threonine phosphatase n=1 Tax=Rhodamnia argentea TaxID=178133 RepID=A0A8B8QR01_9MYRT|nr:protein phosphatase 2C 51-like [Rhodamnia argentea]
MESFVKPPEHDLRLALDGCTLKRKRGVRELASRESAPDGSNQKMPDVPADSVTPRPVESPSSSRSSEKEEDGPIGLVLGGGEGEGDARSLTCVSHGSISVIGRRRSMEDAVTEVPGAVAGKLGSYDFFGVYDGHGGANVANACRDRLHKLLVKEMEGRTDVCCDGGGESEWREVMEASFGKMDEEVGGKGVDSSMRTAGSTAVVAVVGEEEIVVANCGDSRAVLCRGDVAVPLSRDHKPDRPDEKERVEAAGGRVIDWNGSRVLGVLATSRSIGDYYLKPYMTAEPEVTVSRRTGSDNFLMIASDGLWDTISNEVACQVVRRCLSGQIQRRFPEELRGSSAAEAAAVLAELAMARGSQDNISVIVVELKKPNSKSP